MTNLQEYLDNTSIDISSILYEDVIINGTPISCYSTPNRYVNLLGVVAAITKIDKESLIDLPRNTFVVKIWPNKEQINETESHYGKMEHAAVTVEPVAIEHPTAAPAEPASKAQAVLSRAKAKRAPKPATIPEVIEQPPQDAAELRIAVSEEALGGVREVGRKWAERYSTQHPFVADLRAAYAAMQDGVMHRITDATSAAFAQISKLDHEDQGEAADDMAAIMSAIEGATNAE